MEVIPFRRAKVSYYEVKWENAEVKIVGSRRPASYLIDSQGGRANYEKVKSMAELLWQFLQMDDCPATSSQIKWDLRIAGSRYFLFLKVIRVEVRIAGI